MQLFVSDGLPCILAGVDTNAGRGGRDAGALAPTHAAHGAAASEHL
eukprot:gene46127-40038_t